MQPIGFQALECGYTNAELPEERYVAMLHRATKWLVRQPATMPLQEPILEWLDRMVNQTVGLPKANSLRAAMIQWLSERQEDSLPSEERILTLRNLVSFQQLPEDVLQQLVPKLVYQAQHYPDETTRDTIVTSLLKLFRTNDPLIPSAPPACFAFRKAC